ncbi:MAG: inositol-3-phosphate synthase [Gammaproteobacteria bacterium]
MAEIRLAVIGLGNCASALIQGIHYYREHKPEEAIGLMHHSLGGFTPGDIEVVAAFDIDARKVGRDVAEAVFAAPNCTRTFQPKLSKSGVRVSMGKTLDGVSEHLADYPARQRFEPSDETQPDGDTVVRTLREAGAEIVINYLPVGSEQATRFYTECALEAGCGFVNCIPVFIASDPAQAARFTERKLPVIGDDIKSQLGATITHRALANLFHKRGVKLDRTYQLNIGGNTDFLNMLNRSRLASKKTSKTEAVQAAAGERIADDDIHVGPSDYVPWQKDNKIAFIRMEGRLFGDVPMNLELRLSVEDSPNSAGVAIDAIRCAKLALERGQSGALEAPSAWFCKHPPRQFGDDEAWRRLEDFIGDHSND